MAQKKRKKARRREKKSIPTGRAYIQSSFNNTIVTLTDPQGNVIAWGSSGSARFKGRPRCGAQGYGARPAPG
jgi:small subunit ribosomal protein S11